MSFLEVPGEMTGIAECSVTIRTLMRSLGTMDSLEMNLQITRLAEGLIAERTLVRPISKVDSLDMPLQVTIYEKFLRTKRTTVFFLLDLASPFSPPVLVVQSLRPKSFHRSFPLLLTPASPLDLFECGSIRRG